MEDEVTFQHDGASPHYAFVVRQYLDERFSGDWIGSRVPLEWQPRSPDLTPIHFILGAPLKLRGCTSPLRCVHQ